MTSHWLYRPSRLGLLALVGVFSSVAFAHAQANFAAPSQAEALSAAANASPKLAKAMAKELGSTPEQAAGMAGALFSIAKSLLKPEDFDKVAKAVPGMDALLATVPPDTAGTPTASSLLPTPGFASSSAAPISTSTPASSSMPVTMAAPGGIGSAISILSKMGINPAMIGKAIPFLTEYLKKNGGKAVSGMLGQVFKSEKK